jgi:poly(3-hydroxybutyrate) depolymerase
MQRCLPLAALLVAAAVVAAATSAAAPSQPPPVRLGAPSLAGHDLVRVVKFSYRAFNGQLHSAFVVLPRWYGPKRNPPIPLVLSPHGRGIEPQVNASLWGNLPAYGPFAVVNPEGQGRRSELASWGARGDIADLARMPRLVRRALPWLRIDPHRIYAVGGSMGGQSVLLLDAEYPRLLARAAALDAPTNLATRYAAFGRLPNGMGLQRLARLEVGGTPRRHGDAYADRSPLSYARALARSRVPLQIWWSTHDRVVVDQARQSGLLYRTIKRLAPRAPVSQVIGTWQHSAEMRPDRQFPVVLARLGLLRLAPGPRPSSSGQERITFRP